MCQVLPNVSFVASQITRYLNRTCLAEFRLISLRHKNHRRTRCNLALTFLSCFARDISWLEFRRQLRKPNAVEPLRLTLPQLPIRIASYVVVPIPINRHASPLLDGCSRETEFVFGF
jgi:hypothetical protein